MSGSVNTLTKQTSHLPRGYHDSKRRIYLSSWPGVRKASSYFQEWRLNTAGSLDKYFNATPNYKLIRPETLSQVPKTRRLALTDNSQIRGKHPLGVRTIFESLAVEYLPDTIDMLISLPFTPSCFLIMISRPRGPQSASCKSSYHLVSHILRR